MALQPADFGLLLPTRRFAMKRETAEEKGSVQDELYCALADLLKACTWSFEGRAIGMQLPDEASMERAGKALHRADINNLKRDKF
jgi:hypothetical protein